MGKSISHGITAKEHTDLLDYSNKQREKIFKWVDVVAPMQACLFSLKSNENIKITSLSDIKKYSIITNRNGAIAQNLLEQGVVDNKNLRQTISMNDNFSMLLAGRVDLMASTKLALYHLIRNRGNEPGDVVKESHCFDVGNLYMAFSPNTSDELVEKFRQALSEFKKESRYQSIINKYFN
jgi:polar amino acid transport system substrate-binding protein